MSDEVREDDHEPEAPAVPSDEVAAAVLARFDGSVFHESHGQSVVYVDAARFADVAKFLRDDERFTMCVDICAVDHSADAVRHCPPGVTPERFEVVANFLSHARNRRIRVICEVPESAPTVPSLTPLYPGCNFPERETFDLFGIVFDGHPEMTRILMPDDWEGHPLRKDFAPARVPVTFKGDPSPR
jgi:NADH/F420H2 dehydrogenase subunit C